MVPPLTQLPLLFLTQTVGTCSFGMVSNAMDPESFRMNRMFGATRAAVVNGSSGMSMAALTGSASNVASSEAGAAHHRRAAGFGRRDCMRLVFIVITAAGSDR